MLVSACVRKGQAEAPALAVSMIGHHLAESYVSGPYVSPYRLQALSCHVAGTAEVTPAIQARCCKCFARSPRLQQHEP